MSTYTLSGLSVEGGDSAFNGDYVESGTYNGKPSYVSAGGKYIFHNGYDSWMIDASQYTDEGFFGVFYVASSADTPPTVGWQPGMNSMSYENPTVTLLAINPALTLSSTAYILSTTSLQIEGALTSDGGSDTSITCYWGTTDEGEVAGSWANTSDPTSPSQPMAVGTFTKTLTGLTVDTLYYYKVKGTNTTGTTWSATYSGTPVITDIGGLVSIVAGNEIHKFITSDSLILTSNKTAKVLIVAGGAGGGYARGGGGGAGGYIYSASTELTAGTLNVIVGTGGISDTNGEDSSFNALTAIGGGTGGGEPGYAPHGYGDDGGSGGGSIQDGQVGLGTVGQGNDGSSGSGVTGGGGGGAGSVGYRGDGVYTGKGGDGVQNDITGVTLWYAGGGGAGGNNSCGVGGSGIGGNGSFAGGDTSTAGAINTGSGGGGGSGTGSRGHGGAGADGIVILSYDYAAPEPPATTTQASFLFNFM